VRVISAEVLGRPIEMDDATLATILSPRHFIEVRTTPGGPAPAVISKAIEQSTRALEADRQWVSDAAGRLTAAEESLTAAVREL
jgi:argininosuccinate lyase